jgi:hypothetical protein
MYAIEKAFEGGELGVRRKPYGYERVQGTATHRRDVGEVHRQRLPSDVRPRAIPKLEILVLDQHVGREQEPVPGRVYDRGVVTCPDLAGERLRPSPDQL